MEDKNYEVEVAPETPFPGEPLILSAQVQPSQGGNYSPTTTREQSFKRKRTAVELLSTALNTRSKKILQEFSLQDSGGFKVGDFKSGVSGDLRITPNGLTARNISGITTFAIDGDTGDAVFKGTIRSGSIITDAVITDSIISGDITLGGSNNEEGILTILNGNSLVKVKADNKNYTIYNDSNNVSFHVNYTQEIVEVGDLILGQSGLTDTTVVSSGAFRVYDSTILFAKLNVDDGLQLLESKHLTFTGTIAANAPATNSVVLYVDQSGGKNRLMARFPTGAAQQIAIEP